MGGIQVSWPQVGRNMCLRYIYSEVVIYSVFLHELAFSYREKILSRQCASGGYL